MNTFLSDLKQETIQYYDALVAFTPKFLMAIIVLAIAWFIARKIRRFAGKRFTKRMEDPLLADFLATLIWTFIWIIGISLAFKVLGLGGVTASIMAGAGITAFIIGFALRDIGENFLAGILMAFKRPFRVGDFVETLGIRGHVVALNIRDTQLKTPDGKDVYIPNANIIKNPLTNFTIDGFLRFDFVVSLPDGTEHEKATATIHDAVSQVKGVLKTRRKTTVHISAIAPGRLDATVSFWIDTFATKETAEKIRSEVILAAHKAMNTDQP